MSFIKYLEESSLEVHYSIKDISIILCVKLGDKNHWIQKRLLDLSSWFTPCPNIIVIDSGSVSPYSTSLKQLCKDSSYHYHYVETTDDFSLSKARNIGFTQATTDLLFFTDPDFLFERDIFTRLLKTANAAKFSSHTFQRITMPAYHMAESTTAYLDAINDNDKKESQLIAWTHQGVYAEYNQVFEHISPYSNNFLCHRDYYNLVGGYSSKFTGHGSEDFEFMVRANLLQETMPIPKKLAADINRPGALTSERPSYRGFRRLAEVEAFSGELQGFRAFHLWHPRIATQGWYENSDITRKVFTDTLSNYIDQKINLLKEDYLPRHQQALVIISNTSHLGFFLPLRILGYSFDILSETTQIKDILSHINQGKYQRVFVYNPYTENTFEQVITVLSTSTIPVTVIERGALPNSIYYAEDMSYKDPDFLDLSLHHLEQFYKNHHCKLDTNLLKTLKSGSVTLEIHTDYQTTLSTLENELDLAQDLNIFIPLQLPYDTAITLFNEDYPHYEVFLDSIELAIAKHPKVQFIIKPHPLLKRKHYPDFLTIEADNLTIMNSSDNIHAIIEKVDAVVLYNSGVGLLSLFHNKRLFHVGNAYYTANQHFATRVDTVNQAIKQLYSNRVPAYSEQDVQLFLFWLVHYKYSFFEAIDEYRELENRKSHHYQNIRVALFNYNGKSYRFGSLDPALNYSCNSYAAEKLRLHSEDDHREFIQSTNKHLSFLQKTGSRLFTIITFPYLTAYDKLLLKNDPKLFFRTAKHPFSVWAGKTLKLR